ncbi:MAG TPA: FAD:protein FMN transferase [Candidatus Paceibacterota bacterium]|nr:FAD:protein FMN transferase [Candidatus Paceibacterota bacterium]
MKEERMIMGMPVTVEIADASAGKDAFNEVFSYFDYVDKKFSTYKGESEISKINRNELAVKDWSDDMGEIFFLSEKTKEETDGFFDIKTPEGKFDPSGIVKGWAIRNAAGIISEKGFRNFYVEAGGDIQTSGNNEKGTPWRVGIKNPFNKKEIVKVISVSGEGVATSGMYERGEHIYNPKTGASASKDVASITVIGPDIYEADRFATAAFAMGAEGISFIENLKGFDGYMIDGKGVATMTSGFKKYAA